MDLETRLNEMQAQRDKMAALVFGSPEYHLLVRLEAQIALLRELLTPAPMDSAPPDEPLDP